MPLRRLRLLAALAALACALVAAPAEAARIVTWDDPAVAESRFVDPLNDPPGDYYEPPGVPERPNALKANVYLPDGYAADPERRWPLLVLLHGHGDAYDFWAHPLRGDLLDTVQGFDGVILMPEGGRGWYTNWWNGGRRGAPAWARYHLEQLVPLAMERLRIRPGRRWHALAGMSMGGEGTMYYASQLPGFFGSAASFSGTLSIQRPEYQLAFDAANGEPHEQIWGDTVAQRFYWDGHDPTKLVENLEHTRLYLATGNGVPNPDRPEEVENIFGAIAEAEIRQQNREFVAAARLAGLEPTWNPHQGIHDWPYWRQDLRDAIHWGLFRPVADRPRNWTYETVSEHGEMWGIGFDFARPPATVETFERSGPRLNGDGAGRVTLRFANGCEVTRVLPFSLALGAAQDC